VERTQISLEREQAERLRALAAERGVSMAHLVREAVDRVYGSALAPPSRDELWERAMSVVGSGSSGREDVSANHDEHLAEIYAT
jgi:hypothetical protein